MSETKLDQSLDEIVSTQRQSGRISRGRGRARGARATQTARPAPVGGIRKASKPSKAAAIPAAATAAAATHAGDRIQVSNLPRDVSEAQIKEYFVKSVGPIKRVEISYGPGGQSRGIATIIFRNADGPKKALDALNGILVDGRPIKIDIILAPRQAAALVAKSLGDRISTKNQPKTAGTKKAETTKTPATRGGKKPGKPRTARPAKKTAAELDSEMADYFEQGATGDNAGAATNGTATNGEAMDEVL